MNKNNFKKKSQVKKNQKLKNFKQKICFLNFCF